MKKIVYEAINHKVIRNRHPAAYGFFLRISINEAARAIFNVMKIATIRDRSGKLNKSVMNIKLLAIGVTNKKV